MRATTLPPHSDPEPDPPPLNWALIETVIPKSGLAPGAALSRGERSLAPLTPKPVPLDSHRKKLEADGTESGRGVQSQYRQELIKLKRELTDKQMPAAPDPPASWRERLLDRLREQIGDFLTEPSLGQILGLILVVIAVLCSPWAYRCSSDLPARTRFDRGSRHHRLAKVAGQPNARIRSRNLGERLRRKPERLRLPSEEDGSHAGTMIVMARDAAFPGGIVPAVR